MSYLKTHIKLNGLFCRYYRPLIRTHRNPELGWVRICSLSGLETLSISSVRGFGRCRACRMQGRCATPSSRPKGIFDHCADVHTVSRWHRCRLCNCCALDFYDLYHSRTGLKPSSSRRDRFSARAGLFNADALKANSGISTPSCVLFMSGDHNGRDRYHVIELIGYFRHHHRSTPGTRQDVRSGSRPQRAGGVVRGDLLPARSMASSTLTFRG